MSLFLSIPNYLALSVKGTTSITSNGANQTLYSITVRKCGKDVELIYLCIIQWSPLAESNDLLLYKLNVWFYSFFLKLVPCTLLSIITCLLTRALCQVTSLCRFILTTCFVPVLQTVSQSRQTKVQEQHDPEDEASQRQKNADR